MAMCWCPGRKVRAKKRKEQEPLVLDVSTMNLRSIIKVAYAKERARLEEEKRKKVTPLRLRFFSPVPCSPCGAILRCWQQIPAVMPFKSVEERSKGAHSLPVLSLQLLLTSTPVAVFFLYGSLVSPLFMAALVLQSEKPRHAVAI